MKLSFVLVSPARAANVGAAARAIKTQGFSELIVVSSQAHLEKEAAWVACGAEDILANIREVASLEELREEFELMVATTARERGSPRHYLSPAELGEQLSIQQEQVQHVAIVFGCEASGLSNADLAICDLLSYVPLATEYPSLNLAQAVMVYSYALGQALTCADGRLGLKDAQSPLPQLSALKQKAATLLERVDAADDAKLSLWLNESLSRLSDRDAKMAHQLLGDILKKLD
ncbi:tRNA (cytidine/uridine-2'-O-)-methyltransferase TrmJ [Shewanella carassii]|uniref:tRNA/rRNA methyltransferase n=1 Tax=Shewanella carassii TaxID=1987584 RepID=UPI001BEF8078|nr:tRNA/rRNA methyltransferase [Shewanella carassii]BCV66683.1 tRNA (cytidine/uridine-2'-O-)-methyltransferase TrmJ [Shewanella carassii]